MKTEGLRYTFVEDDDEHGPDFAKRNRFKILEGETLIAYAVSRAAALKITRALNREDLRVFAAQAKPQRARRSTPAAPRPTPKRRFRSKRKL
jgi:hypothetical protein